MQSAKCSVESVRFHSPATSAGAAVTIARPTETGPDDQRSAPWHPLPRLLPLLSPCLPPAIDRTAARAHARRRAAPPARQVETVVGEAAVRPEPPGGAARRATWGWLRVVPAQVGVRFFHVRAPT